ncbi:sugar porter family MFS transporter [Larkinella humicola]|uniref:Sugar porter family MFS transporter n=1 Tax=Larkinella humicola TaxID=2607654 RepID=A0A5N1JJR7_9BACT|nr:sugar porter family MFS transporter [Larkinella humicola]KAA9354020.1 sugar porter family MFS transporter [Larkinella humicola]
MAKTGLNANYIFGIAFISALGGYLFGFDFAVISGTLPFLRGYFGLTAWWEGFLTGSLALGCMLGCVLAGNLADRYGRKPGLMVAALIFALSSLGMAFSSTLPVFITMRFVAGIGVGMASTLSPLYIAEISPAEVRGRNVSINQLTIVIGILITNLVNYALADNGPDAWRWMFGLGAVPSAGFLLGVFWLPESPRWLVQKGRVQEGETILRRIGGESFVKQTVTAINRSMEGAEKPSLSMLLEQGVRPAVIVGIGLAVLQQLCGINVVFNYTSTIFETVGANLDRQLFETVAIGIVNLVFTLVAMWQVDKLGRKPLMLIGTLGLAVLYVVIAVLLKTGASSGLLSVFVLLAISVYATSLAPITWVLISEIFPNRVRGLASSVAILALWGAYFILVFTFPILAEQLGTYGPFGLYAVICLVGFWFVRRNVRETKGKTLEELEDTFTAH